VTNGTGTRIDQGELFGEEMPSLVEFADEPGGSWPDGWYGATVLEGYATKNGTVWQTADEPSKKGDSRNLRLCLKLDGGKLGTRNTFVSLNYRVDDFTSARLEQIKEMRQEFKGTQGKWPGHEDSQRTSLAIAKLGQVEKAFGFRLRRSPQGFMQPGPFVGKTVDVRLGPDKNGQYSEVKAYAPFGSRAKAK